MTDSQPTEIYKKLAGSIAQAGSERIARLWSMLCDEEEAALLLAMPATMEQLAQKTGRNAADIEQALKKLFIKGVTFERVKDGATIFNRPKNMVQFHDASVLWPDATLEFHDLWREFMDEEYPAFVNMLGMAGLKAFMRIVPVNKSLKSTTEVLPHEQAAAMIREARALAVTKCTCRVTQRKCERPVEVCIQLNRGAEYALKRGTGRAITVDEALEILDIAEKAGLVHLTENKSVGGNVLCNCCPCCCMAIRPIIQSGSHAFATTSRYACEVSADDCTMCMECLDRCPAGAISPNGSAVVVDRDRCIGCGLCASACPTSTLSLIEVRPPEFIP